MGSEPIDPSEHAVTGAQTVRFSVVGTYRLAELHRAEGDLAAATARIAALEGALTARCERLQEALQEQWEANHAEHCEARDCTGSSDLCGWLRPAILSAAGEGD